jgi:hypothetical protein
VDRDRFLTKSSHHGLSRRRILCLDLFEFFLELILPDVIELPQAIYLPQRELGFPEIAQPGLAVVLTHILVRSRHALVKF